MVVDNGMPPPELELAWLCGDHLPEAGGVMDQDRATMVRMRKSENIYKALYHFTHARGEAIHALSDSERRVIKWLIERGYYAR